jgi:hypothetical protein
VVSQALLSRHQRRCLWQPNFASFGEARTAITHWIGWDNAKRPHQTLGHCSPRQWRARYNPNSWLDIGVALQLRGTGLNREFFKPLHRRYGGSHLAMHFFDKLYRID